ncbi:MAG TPA: hypothetical protein VMV58_01085, partial [Desulfosporosinus sp.]|nr:hypothetical protein [Desulfosporosinus sp.]
MGKNTEGGNKLKAWLDKNPEVYERFCCLIEGKCWTPSSGQCLTNCGLLKGNLHIPDKNAPHLKKAYDELVKEMGEGTETAVDEGQYAIGQEIPSADTSQNQRAATFKTVADKIGWEKGTRNADIGAGKYTLGTEFLKEQGVENLTQDPFNLSKEHNEKFLKEIEKKPADTATVNNVLNVIKDPADRSSVIGLAAKAIKPDGAAYFKVHEGDKSGKGRITKEKDGVAKSWQENRTTSSYVNEIKQYFKDVNIKHGLIVAETPKLPQYQLGKSIPVVGNQTLVDVLRKAPPLSGATFGLSNDGSVWVRNKDGMGFNVKSVTHIAADRVALEIGHGRMLEDGEFIKGKYQNGTVELQKDMADEWTVTHEAVHAMIDMGMITRFDASILENHVKGLQKKGKWDSETRKPGSEEDWVKYATEFMHDRSVKGPVGRVLQKIADYVDMFVNIFKRTAKGVLRDIESGKMFEGKAKEVNEFAQAPSYTLAEAAKNILKNPAFVKWFGESKVVDEKGEPLVVYHGTRADFDIFKSGNFDVGIHLGTAEQASDRLEFVAGEKIGLPNQAILPLYVKIENPLILKTDPGLFDFANLPYALEASKKFSKDDLAILKDYESQDYRLEDEIPEGRNLLNARKNLMNSFRVDVKSLLNEYGYDGFKYWNTGEIKGMAEIMRRISDAKTNEERSKVYKEKEQLEKTGGDWSYVALEPTQIKSIYNRGTFSETDPRILYEKTAARWHSQMTKFISDKLPGKSSPAQFKQMINAWAKKGKFKAEELEWSGVNEWLSEQKGKVTKQDVLTYLAENNVRLEEVEKGVGTVDKDSKKRVADAEKELEIAEKKDAEIRGEAFEILKRGGIGQTERLNMVNAMGWWWNIDKDITSNAFTKASQIDSEYDWNKVIDSYDAVKNAKETLSEERATARTEETKFSQ